MTDYQPYQTDHHGLQMLEIVRVAESTSTYSSAKWIWEYLMIKINSVAIVLMIKMHFKCSEYSGFSLRKLRSFRISKTVTDLCLLPQWTKCEWDDRSILYVSQLYRLLQLAHVECRIDLCTICVQIEYNIVDTMKRIDIHKYFLIIETRAIIVVFKHISSEWAAQWSNKMMSHLFYNILLHHRPTQSSSISTGFTNLHKDILQSGLNPDWKKPNSLETSRYCNCSPCYE